MESSLLENLKADLAGESEQPIVMSFKEGTCFHEALDRAFAKMNSLEKAVDFRFNMKSVIIEPGHTITKAVKAYRIAPMSCFD